MSMPKLLFYLHTEEQIKFSKKVKFLKKVWPLAGIEALNEGEKYSTFIDLYCAKALR